MLNGLKKDSISGNAYNYKHIFMCTTFLNHILEKNFRIENKNILNVYF